MAAQKNKRGPVMRTETRMSEDRRQKMLRDVFGDEWRQPAVFLPGDEVRGVRAVDDVGGADAGGKFLIQPLEQPLRAGTLDLHGNAGILRLERLAELLADWKIHR